MFRATIFISDIPTLRKCLLLKTAKHLNVFYGVLRGKRGETECLTSSEALRNPAAEGIRRLSIPMVLR